MLVSSWDTTLDADQFFQAHLDLVAARSLGQWDLVVEAHTVRLWQGEGIAVELDGDTTVLAIGPDRQSVDLAIGGS